VGCTVAVDEDFVGEQVSDAFVVEGHQALEEDDVCGADEGGLFEPGVFDEGVLWNSHSVVAFDEIDERFVGEVEVEGVGVVEVVFCDIDLGLVDACVAVGVLL